MAKNAFIGRMIGSTLSRVKEVDVDDGEVVWSEFMWVRVSVDRSKPLVRKKRMKIGAFEPVWVCFS